MPTPYKYDLIPITIGDYATYARPVAFDFDDKGVPVRATAAQSTCRRGHLVELFDLSPSHLSASTQALAVTCPHCQPTVGSTNKPARVAAQPTITIQPPQLTQMRLQTPFSSMQVAYRAYVSRTRAARTAQPSPSPAPVKDPTPQVIPLVPEPEPEQVTHEAKSGWYSGFNESPAEPKKVKPPRKRKDVGKGVPIDYSELIHEYEPFLEEPADE